MTQSSKIRQLQLISESKALMNESRSLLALFHSVPWYRYFTRKRLLGKITANVADNTRIQNRIKELEDEGYQGTAI